MVNEFVPEMHDIGKLIDDDAITSALSDSIPTGYKFDGHLFVLKPTSNQVGESSIPFDFAKYGMQEPSTATWQGIKWHLDAIQDDTPIQEYPDSDLVTKRDILLLILADHLAGAAGRTTAKIRRDMPSVARPKTLYTLWQGRSSDKPRWAVVNLAQLEQMVKYLQTDHTREDYLRDYGEYLFAKPEDETPPRDASSLFAHSELVGKIFRVLKSNLEIGDNPLVLSYAGVKVSTVEEAEGDKKPTARQQGKWRYRLLNCHIMIPQTLVRARDLNVFLLREQQMQKFLRASPDNVMAHTSDSLLLFLPLENVKPLAEVLHGFLDAGFYIEYTEAVGDLSSIGGERVHARWLSQYKEWQCLVQRTDELEKEIADAFQERRLVLSNVAELSKLDAKIKALRTAQTNARNQAESLRQRLQFDAARLQVEYRSLYPKNVMKEDARTLEGVICEVCGLRLADPAFTQTRDQITEALCEHCYGIRAMANNGGKKFDRLEQWDESNALVAWVKVTLDYSELDSTIKWLFDAYVDDQEPLAVLDEKLRQSIKESFRPLVLTAQFTRDYRLLLERFNADLRLLFPSERREEVEQAEYKELYVLQLGSGNELRELVERFDRSLGEIFPRCRTSSPVRLSISIANAKYPYGDHWQFLSHPMHTLNIQYPARKARLELEFDQYHNLTKNVELRNRRVNTFLHNLAAIEQRTQSRILTQVNLMDARNKYPDLADLVIKKGFSARQVLDYYKIASIRAFVFQEQAANAAEEK